MTIPEAQSPTLRTSVLAVRWDNNGVQLLDQTLLPHEHVYLFLDDYRQVIEAIVNMRVRGAPAIGVAGAYGLALAARECIAERSSSREWLKEAASALSNARPTAVNLSWAVERVVDATLRGDSTTAFERALQEAHAILAEDVAANHRIGEEGAALLKPGSQVLTHCNTGALATGGWGTALGVVRSAWAQNRLQRVYLTESRPLLQGARLTAWELVQESIPATLIVDGAAGFLFQRAKINAVILGADRIAANGDVANKIGTFGLAVLAKEYEIPFYVAAPISTIDLRTPNGEAIPIEERAPEEVLSLGENRVAANGIDVWNPSFDVTPSSYLSGIITERGVARAPFVSSLRSLVGESNG